MNKWFEEFVSGKSAIEKPEGDTPPTAKSAKSPDPNDLETSRCRLEAQGISIAILDDGTMRVVQNDREARQAIADGYVIYSPKDMYHAVQLTEHERRMLHSFKKRFGGSVEWRKPE